VLDLSVKKNSYFVREKMKKKLIFLLCFLIDAVCVSQRKKALYLSSELEIGNYLGA